jgi:hypothetical protein
MKIFGHEGIVQVRGVHALQSVLSHAGQTAAGLDETVLSSGLDMD